MTDRLAVEEDEERGGFGSLGSAMQLLVVAWAAAIASFPFNDNSFFTHLATGRIILDSGSVPSTDPFTFTAQGVDWTVQSWLASVAYAGAERLGGELGLRLLVLVVFTTAGLLFWRLSRPAESLILRLLIVSVAMTVATGLWSERPYMVGVIGLAVVWLALEGAVRPWLLVPLLWVWANSHGSFPLAGVLIVAVIAGEVLDRRRARADAPDAPRRAELATELAVLKATVLGSVLAMVGPLGFDVLLFPLKAFTQSEVLAAIVEWQPPAFRSASERAFLVLVLAAFAGLVRGGRWRLAIPATMFSGAAIVAQRNVVMATVVLVPVLAACVPRAGTLSALTRPRLGAAFTSIAAGAAVIGAVATLAGPAWGLGGYPVSALSWLDTRGAFEGDTRVATQDSTGNFLELLDGPEGHVFIDDRADMFPGEVFGDYVNLVQATPAWSTILDTYDIDVVVWNRSKPVSSLVAADDRWQTVFSDSDWIVACRRSSAACATLGG